MTSATSADDEGRGSDQAAPALRKAGARALVVVLWLSGFELLVRTVTRAAHFADVSTALLDALAHTGRVAVLAPPLVALDVTITFVGSTGPGAKLGDLVVRLFARLTSPARLARIGAVTAVGYVVLVRTVGSKYQLPWQAGATYAPLVAAAAAALELVAAEVVRRLAPERVRPLGVAALLIAVTLFAAIVITVTVDLPGRTFRPGTIALTVVVFAIVRAAAPDPRASGIQVGVAAVVAIVLVAVDLVNPNLRRFDSATTPFSVLGRSVLVVATDLDGDGVPRGLDCDDTNPLVSPLATDLPDDGIDQNCMGGDAVLAKSLARYARTAIHSDVRTGRAAPPVRAPIYFVTIDAWRADSFDDATFPETRALTKSCHEFTRARSAVAYTGPSMVSLHMGVFPRHVYTDDGAVWIEEANLREGKTSRPPSLAATMTMEGQYWTSVVFPIFNGGNMLFLTGHVAVRVVPPGSAFFPDAAAMFAQVEPARAEARRGLPLFLRTHLMDLHAPYRGRAGHDGYLATARELDRDLAAFLRTVPKDAIVVLTGDHGEAFGEHGYWQHGHTLFDEELRVPLVLCTPERLGLGEARRIDAPVSLVDIMPTLLDLTGLDAPYRRHGQSLVPLLLGRAERRPWVYAENILFGQRAVVLGCNKLISDPKVGMTLLFNLCSDPGERRDLSRAQPDVLAQMNDLLAGIVDLDLDAFRSSRVGTSPVE